VANKKHLEILRKGTQTWNQWREKNPQILPDLSRANLNNIKLSRANLGGVNLREAELRNADLRGTNLYEANLDRADLREVNREHVTFTISNYA
jgi:hypothetical protein